MHRCNAYNLLGSKLHSERHGEFGESHVSHEPSDFDSLLHVLERKLGMVNCVGCAVNVVVGILKCALDTGHHVSS